MGFKTRNRANMIMFKTNASWYTRKSTVLQKKENFKPQARPQVSVIIPYYNSTSTGIEDTFYSGVVST